MVRAMGLSRLTPGSFGLVLRKTTGERGGLPPDGTLRSFQFLTEPLDFVFKPLLLSLQPLVLPLQMLVASPSLVVLFSRSAQLLRQFSDATDWIEGLEKQIIL